MSRVAKEKILLNEIKSYQVEKNNLLIIGNLGEKNLSIPDFLEIKVEDKTMTVHLNVEKEKQTKHHLSMHGTIVRLIKNAIKGTTEGFSTKLFLRGLGYKYVINEDKTITFFLGYSHPILLRIPDYINIKVINANSLEVTSIDNVLLGNYCYKIMKLKKWIPYLFGKARDSGLKTGKGICQENRPTKIKEIKKTK